MKLMICFVAFGLPITVVWEWKKLPKVFVDLINNPKVRLVGLNILGDIWKLSRDFDLSVTTVIQNNVVELKNLANEVLGLKENWSLSRLVLYQLRKQLDKSADVRLSDWAQPLTSSQKSYAATDAYASLLVWHRLIELKKER